MARVNHPSDPQRRLSPRWSVLAIASGALALLVGGLPRADVTATQSSPIDVAEPPISELWVQNMTAVDPQTSVTARFFGGGRSWDFSPILLNPPPRSQDLLRIGMVAGTLPDGHYAAAIGSNTAFPSAAVVRAEWPASGAAVLYGAGESDARVLVPWVARRFGAAQATSRVHIQNGQTGRTVDVTIRVTALGASQPAATFVRTIPSGAAIEVDLARDAALAALPDGFAGSLSAQAAGGGRIAAVAITELETSQQATVAALGSRGAALGDRLLAPRVTRRRAEIRGDGSSATVDSFIAVMNGGPAPVQVTVSYQGSAVPGNACAGQTFAHAGTPQLIPAGATAVFAQEAGLLGLAAGASGLPENCVASAEIRATGGAQLAATVVEIEDGSRRAGAYEALPAAGAKRVAWLPLFRHGYNDLSTSVHVVNAGDQVTQAQARLVVVYEGRTITVDRSVSLAPGAVASWDAGDFAEIPYGATGSALVTSSRADVPLVAVARETADDGKKDNALYSDLDEPTMIDNPAPAPDEYLPYFAPSVWNAGVYDLGLMATGTTAAEIERIKQVLNTQAYDFSQRTGLTIAVSVQPHMFGKVPFQDWLRAQIDGGFPDVEVRARTWVVGLNYNGVALLGRGGDLAVVDGRHFPGQGDFLDEAWRLNFVTGGAQPSAVPWLRVGCSPNFSNLALVATSMDPDDGFELMQYLVRPEQQRENYQPQKPGRTQIGYPTLKALYTEFAINCPAAPAVIHTAPEDIEEVLDVAVRDADKLAAVFDALDVDVYGDGANAAKALGAESARQAVVAQPMINHLSADELDRRLRSPAGLVAGTISLHPLPTPTPTATATATATSTDTPTPTSTATATTTDTPTPTPTATATATETAMPTRTATATGKPSGTPPTPGTTVPTHTPTATPLATVTATPTRTTEALRPVLLPYLAREHAFGASSALYDRPARPARDGRRAAPSARQQATATPAGGDTAYAIVWRKAPDGTVSAEIVADDGRVVADPGNLGVEVPPVEPRFPGGAEPEGWAQHGSVIVCINVDQYKGCLTVKD